MKILVVIGSLLFTSLAFANQSIVCKGQSGTIKLNLVLNQDQSVSLKRSTIKVFGFTKDTNDQIFSGIAISSVDHSKKNSDVAYANFFLNAGDNNFDLDIQLQFKSQVIGKTFRNEKADFVIGSADANPETFYSFGFDLVCSGRMLR